MSDASVKVLDGRAVVRVGGSELLSPIVKSATDAVAATGVNRAAAELAAATALASSRYFATRAAGQAASAVDQLFSTDDGGGNLVYYRRTSGGSVEIARAVTPSSLASPDGATLVSTQDGRDVQVRFDDLANSGGSAEIGFKATTGGQAIYAAPINLKNYLDGPKVNIRAFVPAGSTISLENPFDLLNRATGADLPHDGNASDLARCIEIDVPFIFPAEDRSVYHRKGQTLDFSNGQQLDLSALVNNTKPVFDLGVGSDGSPDPGGLPPRIIGLSSIGGPATAAVIRASEAVAGYTILAAFITAAGIGIDARGSGDGTIDALQTDLCLIGMIMGGQNNNVGQWNSYNCNYDYYPDGDCFDCGVGYLHSEYAKFGSIFIPPTAHLKGLKIGTHKALQSAQYPTFSGFVHLRADLAEIAIGSAEYRNCKGPAVINAQGIGSRLSIDNLLLDSRRTNPAYDQSTTMAGIDWRNGSLTVGMIEAWSLPGQPVAISGTATTGAFIGGAAFYNCSGGSHEIEIAGVGGGSHTQLYNIYSTRGEAARFANNGAGTTGGNP